MIKIDYKYINRKTENHVSQKQTFLEIYNNENSKINNKELIIKKNPQVKAAIFYATSIEP